MSKPPVAPIPRTCVIAQPTFIPWMGWFDLADQADVMIILDDVQFSKQSWQQRNRLRTPQGLDFLSVSVKSAGRSHQLINEVELANEASVEKLLRTVQGYYARAPYFRELFPGLGTAMREGAATGKLAELNIAVIRWIMQTLGISVPLVRASELETDGKRGEYVAALCEEVGATRYLSPAGAEEYLLLDRPAFDRRNISVCLHVYEHPEYRQCFKPFEPYASVLDLIFNTGPEALAILRSGRRPARPLGIPAPPRRYAFRADASTDIGIGHVMRCLTLARRLRERGGEVRFIARTLPDTYRDEILSFGCGVAMLPSAPRPADTAAGPAHAAWLGAHWEDDAAQTAAAIEAWGGTDVLVIDHYGVDQRWEAVLRPHAGLICVIDDLADRPHDCDVLLDQNFVTNPASRYHGLLPTACRSLFGPGHAPLRPEFHAARTKLRQRDGSIHRIFVFYGGADPNDFTGRTIDALAPRLGPEIEVDVVVGAINPHVEVLRERCAATPYVRLHVQPGNMAELMAAADLAFGACGTASWERCLLGLPAIVVIFAQNQEAPTRGLVEAGAVESLGHADAVGVTDISAAFDRLATNPARCRAMSTAALALMQATGPSLDDILAGEETFEFEGVHLRSAHQDDASDLLAWRNQEDVRVHSRSQEVIDLAEHADWLATVIADPARHLLIGYRGGKPIGVVRLDERDDTGEVSIYLTPDARGQNNGSALLRAQEAWIRATRPAIQRLVAVVLGANDTSHRLFLKNGYTCLPTHYEKRITR
ncbi:UDP-2,4-diacetamido-2,4,6-trideoxy-beta-L-altropyranose hydrolase [Zoogloea sp.]|uniref:UDP-2,4-diacetamido-2,4, 6-trideoxy-beta-L-altropyranose hydrolase n=1 Tax=Zoogloea sp. TaxID=49181 RepID=UPI0026136EE0|nr:UDP-2,4-diacetamido-2,4,6-trideoxy-beta-L-altropyranose hydrolase [Zoogloea sp.]